MPEGYENAGRVVANSNSQEDSYFTDGGFEMVEGNPITTETGSQVLIHEKFAQRNGLSVGDTMLLGNVEDKDKTIPVTVAGIFTNTEEQDSIGMAPSYDLYDNIVFTDLSTASFLLYGTEGTTNVQYGDFYVNDPDELERMMTDVQELDGVDWESCTLTRYDNDYQNAKESLEGLQNIVFNSDPLRQRLSERQGIPGGLAEHRLYRHCCGIGDLFPGAGPVPDTAAPWANP